MRPKKGAGTHMNPITYKPLEGEGTHMGPICKPLRMSETWYYKVFIRKVNHLAPKRVTHMNPIGHMGTSGTYMIPIPITPCKYSGTLVL